MSGVNSCTIQQVELGKENPSIATLAQLSVVLGLELVIQGKQPTHGYGGCLPEWTLPLFQGLLTTTGCGDGHGWMEPVKFGGCGKVLAAG